MLQVTRADTLDDHTLDIELNNGNLILLDISHLLDQNPDYRGVREGGILRKPLTDSRGIYWRDGPSLTTEEILTLLGEQKG